MKFLYSVAAFALISYQPCLATSSYSETTSDVEAKMLMTSFGDSAVALGDRSGNITGTESFYNTTGLPYLAYQSVVGTTFYALLAAGLMEGLPKAPDVSDLPMTKADLTTIFGNMARGLGSIKDKATSFAVGKDSLKVGLDGLHSAALQLTAIVKSIWPANEVAFLGDLESDFSHKYSAASAALNGVTATESFAGYVDSINHVSTGNNWLAFDTETHVWAPKASAPASANVTVSGVSSTSTSITNNGPSAVQAKAAASASPVGSSSSISITTSTSASTITGATTLTTSTVTSSRA